MVQTTVPISVPPTRKIGFRMSHAHAKPNYFIYHLSSFHISALVSHYVVVTRDCKWKKRMESATKRKISSASLESLEHHNQAEWWAGSVQGREGTVMGVFPRKMDDCMPRGGCMRRICGHASRALHRWCAGNTFDTRCRRSIDRVIPWYIK